MASFKVQAASIYVGGTKAVEIETSEIDVEGGDEQLFADGGAAGFSDGATTTKLNVKGFHPKGGMRVSLMKKLIAKQDVDVTVALVDGSIWQITMRILSGKSTSTHKNGTQMGDYTMGGGEPSIV